MKKVVILRYRIPYEQDYDLICVCDSVESANDKMGHLMCEYPNYYTDHTNFDLTVADYFCKG